MYCSTLSLVTGKFAKENWNFFPWITSYFNSSKLLHLLVGESHLIKNFSAIPIILSVSSFRPNGWSNSPPPFMAAHNTAALFETSLVESKPVTACSAVKTKVQQLQIIVYGTNKNISGDKGTTLLYLSIVTAWLRWYLILLSAS